MRNTHFAEVWCDRNSKTCRIYYSSSVAAMIQSRISLFFPLLATIDRFLHHVYCPQRGLRFGSCTFQHFPTKVYFTPQSQARPSCDSVFGDMMVIIIRAQQFDFLSLIQVNSASIYCKTGHPWGWSRIVDKSRVEIKP